MNSSYHREIVKDLTPIVLGIDLGTAYSSMGWARKDSEDEPEIFTIGYWPSDPGGVFEFNDSTEVPSEVLFLSKGDNLSHNFTDTSHLVEVDKICIGYQLQELISRNANIERFHPVRLLKLLLDDSEHTQQTRDDLYSIFLLLREKWNLGSCNDFIVKLMTGMMEHAKSELRRQGISRNVPLEIVISVPVTWGVVACRTIQSVVEKSVQNAGLGSCKDLFLVSEPEAAAVHIINETKCVFPGESFTILDIGGGTVDTTSYQLAQFDPPRLTEELVCPEGSLLGSTFLDNAFRRLLEQRTEGEDRHIERSGNTRAGLIDKTVLHFEKWTKRKFTNSPETNFYYFEFQGLKHNRKKGFEQNLLIITRVEMLEIFQPIMEGIWHLLSHQLMHTRAIKKYIQKVLLVGGFSKSALLRQYLRERLNGVSKKWGYQIEIMAPLERHKHPENTVLLGSIMRALNKADGPERILNCAYGFKRTEEFLFNSRTKEGIAHKMQSEFKTKNELISGYELRDTLYWVVNKDEKVGTMEEFRFESTHFWHYDDVQTSLELGEKIEWEEQVYSADNEMESHYQESHYKNASARCIGRVTVDVSPLFRSGIIQPTLDSEGEDRYEVELELVFTIVCRTLKFDVWVSAASDNGGRVQFNIAADFDLGTA